jgi:hypothetical protein
MTFDYMTPLVALLIRSFPIIGRLIDILIESWEKSSECRNSGSPELGGRSLHRVVVTLGKP